jgi:hypothetical protein
LGAWLFASVVPYDAMRRSALQGGSVFGAMGWGRAAGFTAPRRPPRDLPGKRWADLEARQPTGLDYLYTLLRYVTGAAPELDAKELHAAVVESFAEGETLMPTIAEKWVEQGVQQGEAAVLRRLLSGRFDPLPDWAEERLTHAELPQLETWADRVLEAKTLEEVFEQL